MMASLVYRAVNRRPCLKYGESEALILKATLWSSHKHTSIHAQEQTQMGTHAKICKRNSDFILMSAQ